MKNELFTLKSLILALTLQLTNAILTIISAPQLKW